MNKFEFGEAKLPFGVCISVNPKIKRIVISFTQEYKINYTQSRWEIVKELKEIFEYMGYEVIFHYCDDEE